MDRTGLARSLQGLFAEVRSTVRENRLYPRTFFFHRHQRKADVFERALRQFGWRENRSISNTSCAFFDVDIMNRVEIFNSLHNRGVKLFCYPHAARPQVVYAWRGHKPHPYTSAQFVFAPGHEEVMRLIGYPHPIHVIGWAYCEKLPFKPVEKVKSVLFGPLHPNSNGWLSDLDKEVNQKAYNRLKAAAKEMGFGVTVRFLQTLENNGIKFEEDPNIHFIQGHPDNNFSQIDCHDVVIGTQTLAYIAVARGKPTLMMDEWIPPRAGNSPEVFRYVEGWDNFKHLMMYPHDINTTSDVPALIQHVTRSDSDIQAWKQQMIGAPFSPKKFHEVVSSYLPLPEHYHSLHTNQQLKHQPRLEQ